jgi:hypothetical protein
VVLICGVNMTAAERAKNILLAARLGPLTPFFGIVNGQCECGKPKSQRHKPGKHPHAGGWQHKNATSDHATIAVWIGQHPQANFAVITGVDTVVLDLDIRPGKDGVAELAALEAKSGKCLPPTVTVLSGSGTGAKHLYFKVPPDLARLQKPTGTTAIDFQRNRQAVIVPGSLHESGNYYRFADGLSPDEVEVADLPDWILALMRKNAASTRNTTTITDDIGKLFDELLKIGPPTGSMPPGRLRSDEIVKRKMKSVPMRRYPNDRSHSDSHWAWTLARNCCHHWDQYLRIWKGSTIRTQPGTKCGRASYEGNLLEKAFLDQKQQWKSKLTQRPLEKTANPAIAKYIRKRAATHREEPRSPITKAVIDLHCKKPDLDDSGIASVLNAKGTLDREVTRNNVKRIRHSYEHLW